MKKIKFVDLFSGIGGFHLAIDNYGFKNKIDTELILASEIDEKAKRIYSKNFDVKTNDIKNIRDVNEKEIEDFDILFAGFPCQTFSSAGKQLGFKDKTKGTLFFEIERILNAKQPKYFILENVKHLINHDNGKTYKEIINRLNAAGYITNKLDDPLIIDSYKASSSLQKRERTYILGVRKDLTKDNFIESTKVHSFVDEGTKKDSLSSFFDKNVEDNFYLSVEKDKVLISALEAWSDFIKNVNPLEGRGMPVIWADALSWTSKQERNKKLGEQPSDHWRTKYYQDMFDIYDSNSDYINKWLKKYSVLSFPKREKKFEWHVGKNSKNIDDGYIQLRQSGIRVRRKGTFPTLVAMAQTPIIHDAKKNKWRYITPNEERKLQTFSFADKSKRFKSYSDVFEKGTDASIRASYKQYGNAVTVEVIEKLIDYLLKNY